MYFRFIRSIAQSLNLSIPLPHTWSCILFFVVDKNHQKNSKVVSLALSDRSRLSPSHSFPRGASHTHTHTHTHTLTHFNPSSFFPKLIWYPFKSFESPSCLIFFLVCLALMCRLFACHLLIVPFPRTLKRFFADDFVLMPRTAWWRRVEEGIDATSWVNMLWLYSWGDHVVIFKYETQL